ncbi:MAG: O-methyltransferase [Lachnospiraceae bacterium]|nr:O-methyltransferase [Lachnospiraceae bacterium]
MNRLSGFRKIMFQNERIKDYIDSLIPGNDKVIEEIRTKAAEDAMPIIRRDGEQLLKSVLKMKNPGRILEIGTCVGYSAIVMAANTEADCHISTIEIGENDYGMAVENVRLAGYEDRISCYLADATDMLKEYVRNNERFDFIFMDAAKAQYINWLPDVTKILVPGGVLLSDNVLHDGDIVQSRFAVDRRDRTTHARLREYLYELTHSDEYMTSVLNVADGMSISVRLGKEK